METNLTLDLIEQSSVVSLYSPKIEGEKYSEVEKFILKYNSTEYSEELQDILYRLQKVKENGALDRYFRYESKKGDRVRALPSHLETIHLRLYCIIISPNIIILGNGGVKTTATYNEDPHLMRCVANMVNLDRKIKHLQQNRRITIDHYELKGKLSFKVNYEYENE